ncbi:MAG TPA: T9SS type A sorting domain-containing protein [Ignavibacteriaceae bacterium]|nr:T9SS type A sorting domain-containing protein [Ignavibacteriaceae bacterium]
MRKISVTLLVLLTFGFTEWAYAQGNFSTSLHATRNGKPYFYNTVANGGTGGFETLTGVPMNQLGCVGCHDATDANGTAYTSSYTPSCVDCHATNTFPFPGPVTQNDCLGCHGREAAIISLGISDVHRTLGFTCINCHKKEELHGDVGTSFNSMFDPGAITTDCSNTGCHAGYTHSNPSVDPHGGKIHCTSCHSSTNLACYNCHFETVVNTPNHLRRAQRQIKDFVILVNRTKDNKVHPASFQSLSYQGKTWIAFGPSSAHTIVKTGARTCTDCHANFGGNIPAITDYNADGIMKFGTWNSADSTLSWLKGIIPMPSDWQKSFKLDYIQYDGNVTDPLVMSKNWTLIGDVTDGAQMLYATPLTNTQMAKIGMDTSWTVVPVELTSFIASVNGQVINLSWSTATETNNNGFEIQKKVADKFVPVGFVKGHGTTSEQHNYSFADKQSQAGKYTYRLKQIDFNGKYEYSKEVEVTVVFGLSYSLNQNYPNPFNPITKISYTIPQSGFVELKVYDALGNLVKSLVSEQKEAGSFDVEFNGANLSSGIYYYQLKAGNFTETKKLVLMK